MAGKFVLKRGTTGKFRFNLLASNGRVLATSEAYETRAAAMRGIESVRTNAVKARLEDDTETAGRSKPAARIRRAVERDWEQTKSDLPGLPGRNLNQDADDTVAQATGARRIPAKDTPNRR